MRSVGGRGEGGGDVGADAVVDECMWAACVRAGKRRRPVSGSVGLGGVAAAARGPAGAGMAAGIVAGVSVAPQSLQQAPELAGEVAATPVSVAESTDEGVAAEADAGPASAERHDEGPPPPGLAGLAREGGRGAQIKGSGSFSRAIRREPAPPKAL